METSASAPNAKGAMDMILGKGAHWPLILAFLLAVLLGGCVVKKDSPAPGCVEYWGLSPLGGCFGTTAIIDLEVEPEHACLAGYLDQQLQRRHSGGQQFLRPDTDSKAAHHPS